MGFLQYEAICSFSMSISSLSCGIELAFSVILDTEGVKQKKDRGGGGGGGRLFEGGDYFKYFNKKGAIEGGDKS